MVDAKNKGDRPRGMSDAEISKLCDEVQERAWNREPYSAQAAFVDAAGAFDRKTRGERRAARRAKGVRTGSHEGDLTDVGVEILEALVDFDGQLTTARILEAYCRRAQSTILKALGRLRAAGVIDPDTDAIRWDRFGTQHYDAVLAARAFEMMDAVGDRFPGRAYWVLVRIAAFGSPTLSFDDLELLAGGMVDPDDLPRAVETLRRAGLIHPETLENNREGFDRFEVGSRK
ncbi:hypothetical protein [uncultured Croceicoccus sp.]|uniref:hypothetical protein n=1 Tax=uncultured Croceicoccus sp. TaxID=1295329 RepID=UPI002621D9BE|nr:hypothetical protein [uncultured Croceicoccus sp.]